MAYVEQSNLYPLTFSPLYFERIWGGSQLAEVLGREVPAGEKPIGEAWELVDREDAQSVVDAGPLAGYTIHELVEFYGRSLLGNKWTGGRFPLLIKLIDAGQRLSLQVHPDEKACAMLGNGAEPKTEMWYIISARRGAKIMAGLSPRGTRQQLISQLDSSEVENLLQVYLSQPGDAYFIPTGTIHAIGEGNLLLEIQQNSDTTYRVSDWGRRDSNGKSRELHVEEALKSIDFINRTCPRISGVVGSAPHNRKFPVVNRCRFFAVDSLLLRDTWLDDTANTASFHLLSAIDGAVTIGHSPEAIAAGEGTVLERGRTCLIPACYGAYVIVPEAPDKTTNVVRTTL